MKRKCPYCYGPMVEGKDGFLVCEDLCQHRTCKTCEQEIHFGGIGFTQYLDNTDNCVCWFDEISGHGKEHQP